MNHNFKIGDVVMLSLGSPRITILNVETDMIYGSYKDESGQLTHGRWFHSALRLVRSVGSDYDLGEEPEVVPIQDEPVKKTKKSEA